MREVDDSGTFEPREVSAEFLGTDGVRLGEDAEDFVHRASLDLDAWQVGSAFDHGNER